LLAPGVAQDVDPLPAVRRSNVARSKTVPSRIEPERGKVGEDGIESSSNESCDVFNEHVAGSNQAHGVPHGLPEAGPLAGDSGSEPGVGDVLTGKTSRHEIHLAAVAFSPSVGDESADVAEDRGGVQTTVGDSGLEDFLRIGFVFDVSDDSVPEKSRGKATASGACE
jgi:hypothetical protein